MVYDQGNEREGDEHNRYFKKDGYKQAHVRKYLREGKYSGYSREGRVSIVSQYEDYIRDMINRYNLSAVRIYENIRDKGYRGSYTTVKRICRKYRNDSV